MRASFSSLHSVFFFRNGGETRGRDRTPPDRSSAGPANQRLGEKYLPAVEPREVRRRVSASERPKPLASASARPPGRDPAPGVSIGRRGGGKVWASEEGKGRGALLPLPLPPPRSRGGIPGGSGSLAGPKICESRRGRPCLGSGELLGVWLTSGGVWSASHARGRPPPAGGFRVFCNGGNMRAEGYLVRSV